MTKIDESYEQLMKKLKDYSAVIQQFNPILLRTLKYHLEPHERRIIMYNHQFSESHILVDAKSIANLIGNNK
jgi:hypothetical protein